MTTQKASKYSSMLVIASLAFVSMSESVLAATRTWTFDEPNNYTYSEELLEVTDGMAQLAPVGLPLWFDSTWMKRSAVEVDNSSNPSALTNYQVKVDVSYDADMQADFDDIRFTDDEGMLLDHWLETYTDSVSAAFWVEVDSIPASGTATIYMYFGNDGATSVSNGFDTFLFFDDFTGVPENTVDISFTEVYTTDKDVHAAQGVAFDGTHFYTTAGTGPGFAHHMLYKWDSDWNLVDSRDVENDDPIDKRQINHIHYKDGLLYIGANNYNLTNPRKGWVVVYNASDLTPVTYHTVLNHHSEGAGFYDNAWWVVYDDYLYVSKYDTNWNHIADYELTYNITNCIHGYQGAMWIDDYLYVNIHEACTPETVDVYQWNGNGFDEVARVTPPTSESNQGLALDPDGETVWFAERFHGGGQTQDHRVVKATHSRSVITAYDVDPAIWTEESDAEFMVENGMLKAINGLGKYNMVAPFTPATSVWVEWNQQANSLNTALLGGLRDSASFHMTGIRFNDFTGYNGSGWSDFGVNMMSANTWYPIKQRVTPGSNSVTWYGGPATANKTVTSSNFNQLYFRVYHPPFSGYNLVDDFRVRVYSSVEPSVFFGPIETIYSTAAPDVSPTTANAQEFTSLSGFSSTEILNGGDVKFQVSTNNGGTWYWYNSGWSSTTSGYEEASTVTDIDANIASLPLGSGQFLFRAFLGSDGTQLVQLDDVTLTYENNACGGNFSSDNAEILRLNQIIDSLQEQIRVLESGGAGIDL